MPNIFISYRRDDTSGYAGHIYDQLAKHFGRKRVFRDIDIPPGMDFKARIISAIGKCEAVVAIIDKDWLTDRLGRRRLDDPADFVRLEIRIALSRNLKVIPVLVANAPMPSAQDLPNDLSNLALLQAIEIHRTEFDSCIARLVRAVDPGYRKRMALTLIGCSILLGATLWSLYYKPMSIERTFSSTHPDGRIGKTTRLADAQVTIAVGLPPGSMPTKTSLYAKELSSVDWTPCDRSASGFFECRNGIDQLKFLPPTLNRSPKGSVISSVAVSLGSRPRDVRLEVEYHSSSEP